MIKWFAKLRQTITSTQLAKFFGKDFFTDDLLYYAASLSFYTIFALVPILLISVTIMANLPLFESYYLEIKDAFLANIMPSQTKALIAYMDTILENGVKVGVMGIFYIVVTSIFFFNNYEYIVSQIFNKPKKSFFKALSTYWTLMTFTPILLALILFLTASAADNISSVLAYVHLSFNGFVSFLLTWLMFAILMKASINFKVSFRAVIRSSFITALLWFIAQKLFITYIFVNTTYASLYGSFSSLLFFFLWIHISWIIYLFGLKSSALTLKKDSEPEKTTTQNQTQV